VLGCKILLRCDLNFECRKAANNRRQKADLIASSERIVLEFVEMLFVVTFIAFLQVCEYTSFELVSWRTFVHADYVCTVDNFEGPSCLTLSVVLVDWGFLSHGVLSGKLLSNGQFTSTTPTRLSSTACSVESRRRRRCELDITCSVTLQQ